MHFVSYGYQMVVAAIIVFIIGGFYLMRLALNIEKKYRAAIYFIIAAFLVHFAGGYFSWRFVSTGLNYENILWIIEPLLILIEAILLLVGAMKFFNAIKR